jgi:o-succinylbenzoate synthase
VTTPLPLPESVTLHEIRVPFRRPLVTKEATYTERRSVLVGIGSDGLTGWGEAAAFPSGRWGTADDAWDSILEMEPGHLPAVPIASAAVQAARADLAARRAGVPLHTHLGGRRRPVNARHTLGLSLDPRELVDRVDELVADGIRAVKVKITPGLDVEPTLALRAAHLVLDIGVDANGSYDDPEDIVFDALDHLGVSTIDQPFPAEELEAHAALRRRVEMNVCLDETIVSVASAVAAIAAHAADVVSVKVGRLGLTATAAILASARTTGTGFKVGGTFDTSIGRRHLLAVATHGGVTDAEISPPSGYLAADVADYPPLVDGAVTPDEGAGIGVDPDPDRLAELEVRRTVVAG